MELSCPLETICRVAQEKFLQKPYNTVNPLLTKLVWLRWLDVGFIFFASILTSTPSRSIDKHKLMNLVNIQPS